MDINKKRDLEYIKGFQKIKLSAICKELNIDKPSIYRGTASKENIRKVKEEIKRQLEELEKD